MSVQSQISRIQGEVSSQEELINRIAQTLAGKGQQGEVLGDSIQKVTGTCVGDDTGYVNVEVGFQPDFVLFENFAVPVTNGGLRYDSAVACFTETPVQAEGIEIHVRNLDGKEYLLYPVQTSKGFVIERMLRYEDKGDGNGLGWYELSGYTLYYRAVKYTGSLRLPVPENPGTAEDLQEGKQLVGPDGSLITGVGKTLAVRSGTTTSRTVETGLSEIRELFLYKESQTATGLIHLHYSKETGTSRMYASSWSTNMYGSKTITNGTGGVTVEGGTLTLSATNATQGGLSANVTYKWTALGLE